MLENESQINLKPFSSSHSHRKSFFFSLLFRFWLRSWNENIDVMHSEYFINIMKMHSTGMVTMCFITGLQARIPSSLSSLTIWRKSRMWNKIFIRFSFVLSAFTKAWDALKLSRSQLTSEYKLFLQSSLSRKSLSQNIHTGKVFNVPRSSTQRMANERAKKQVKQQNLIINTALIYLMHCLA